MKKNILLFVLLITASAFAEKPYGTAGCGFGSVIIGKNDAQVIAATTNNLSTQTFSISSGTSNCTNVEQKTVRIRNFIEANQESLITEMAKGNGETIATLSSLYGCKTITFTKEIQKNYSQILSAKENASLMMKEIDIVIRNNAELKNACQYVI
jgi:hypothetical protein